MGIYYYTVAQAPTVEIENDQPKLLTNTRTLFAAFGGDHVWGNEDPFLAGKHKRTLLIPQTTQPVNPYTDQSLYWGDSTGIRVNTGSSNSYSAYFAQPNSIPFQGLKQGAFTFSSGSSTYPLSWNIITFPLVGTPYFQINIKVTTLSAGSTSIYIFVPYQFTIPTKIISAASITQLSATNLVNSNFTSSTPVVVSTQFSAAYLNGVVFLSGSSASSGMTIIAS